MRRPRIALFVANHIRDLPGMVLVARELCKRGATCYLVPYRHGRREIWAIAPDFVLLPAIRPYQAEQAWQFVEANIQFGLLDTEGTVWSSMDEYRQTLWNDHALTRHARCICLWGPAAADHTIGAGIYSRDQVYITGCPRFDYYRSPFSLVYRGNSQNSEAVERKSILINTNFTTANAEGFTYPTIIDNFVKTYGYPREEVLRWYDNGISAIKGIKTLASQLGKHFPSADIIIRPHPEERADTYLEGLDSVSNVRVVKSKYIAPWILASSAIIQRSCTTAIESTCAGIPALSPQWIPANNFYPIPEAVSLPCENYDELRQTIGSVLAGEFRWPQLKQQQIDSTIASWFFKMDGLAHQRVAAAILESISVDSPPDRDKCKMFLHKLRSGRNAKARFTNLLRYKLDLSPELSFRKMRSLYRTEMDEHFNEQEVQALLASLHRIESDTTNPPMKVSRANNCDAYITSKYRGRSLVIDRADSAELHTQAAMMRQRLGAVDLGRTPNVLV